MLTREQADTLRGHASNLAEASKAYGRGLAVQLSEKDWKDTVARYTKANNNYHSYLRSCTEQVATPLPEHTQIAKL